MQYLCTKIKELIYEENLRMGNALTDILLQIDSDEVLSRLCFAQRQYATG